ncbi:hypothetical protein BH11PLA2_BH11PLA2_13350 [soil metagenome]
MDCLRTLTPHPAMTRPPLPDAQNARVPSAGQDSYWTQRLLDIAVALPALLVAVPVVIVAAILVRLTSRGPAFYSQQRSGRDGRPFRILKLRTMYHNCEAESGACWSTAGDPRITRVGRWLRKLHVDELPQIGNVLRGEMSVVGPRPERPEIIDDLAASIPDYLERLAVRPGVTGLAQIQQPPDVTSDCVRRKLLYDRHYIRNRSLATDFRIIFGTALYLAGVSYAGVRRLAGFTVPAMPDDVVSYRIPAAPCDAPATLSASMLESPQGVSG